MAGESVPRHGRSYPRSWTENSSHCFSLLVVVSTTHSDRDPLDEVAGDAPPAPVVDLGGAGVGVPGQVLDVLERHVLAESRSVTTRTRNEWGERIFGSPAALSRRLSISCTARGDIARLVSGLERRCPARYSGEAWGASVKPGPLRGRPRSTRRES